MIKSDFFRYTGKNYSFYNLIYLILKNRCFFFQFLLRLSNKYYKIPLIGLMFRFLIKIIQIYIHIQISPRTKIGKGFIIGHYGNIVVAEQVSFGDYCSVTHGVTIGGAGKIKEFPKIGNYVWIGTNSVIVGGIKIGNNVLIAPNSFVNYDVPSNSIVVGDYKNIISKSNATKNYIHNTIEKYKY